MKHLKRGTHSQKKQEVGSFYTTKQAAASFESLPEGPDPREVVRDVHHIIPALTRKGSVFRVSHETAEQRGAEFAAMISGLFNPSPNAPVLLQELRNATPIRDFFGFWRRDHELAEKVGKNLEALTFSRGSMIDTLSRPESSISKTSLAGRLRHSFSVQLGNKALGNIHVTAQTPSSAPPEGTRHSVNNRMSSGERDSEQGPLVFTDEFLLRPSSSQSSIRSPGKFGSQQSRSPGIGLPPSPTQLRSPSSMALYRIDKPIPEEDIIAPSMPRNGVRPRSNSATVPGHHSLAPLAHSNQRFRFANAHLRNSDHSSLSKDDPIVLPSSSAGSVSSDSSDLSSMFSTSAQETQRFSVCSDVSEDDESIYEHMADIASSFPSPPTYQHNQGIPKDSWRDSFSSIRTEASADGVLPRHLRRKFSISQSDVPQQDRIIGEEDDHIEHYSGELVLPNYMVCIKQTIQFMNMALVLDSP